MPKKYFFFLLACILPCCAYCQNEESKSIAVLQQKLKSSSNELSRCNVILDLALAYVLKPGEFANDLDSASLLIEQAETSNEKKLNSKVVEAKIFYTYANLYREKGDRDKGEDYCEKSINIYKTLPPSDAFGEAYIELANYRYWDDKKKKPSQRDCYANAVAQFKQTGNANRQGFALKNLADIDNVLTNYGQALVELQQALDVYKTINYPNLQGVYDLFGAIYDKLGDLPSAVRYGLLAFKACEAVKDTTLQLCTICFRLGIAYADWNQDRGDEAIIYLRKAVDIALKYNDQSSIQITVASLSTALTERGRYREAANLLLENENRIHITGIEENVFMHAYYVKVFLAAGEKSLAKKSVDTLIKILPAGLVANPLNTYFEKGYQALVIYYLALHQPNLAEKYADLNLEYLNAVHEVTASSLAAFRYKAKADSAAGDFVSALKYFRKYADLKDSLFNEKKSFQFTQMQAFFETEKKDNELKVLQVQNALNNAALQRSRQIRNSIIVAALLLLALFYAGYRFKQRSNLRLQKKQDQINRQNNILTNTIEEKNQLLIEKEWLVKEIHHRVKNNLQIVISLLNTQSHYINNEEAIAAITESRHRMEAMSLIHQKLYQSENTTSVNMKTYIHELTDYLKASFITGNKISFTLAVEALEIDIAQAVPLGLILNETITNSIKYAFANQEHGEITITMHKKETNDIVLEIKDNGRGLPNHFDINNSNSMGMRLIAGLAKQIDGTLTVMGERGVTTTILFKQHIIATSL